MGAIMLQTVATWVRPNRGPSAEVQVDGLPILGCSRIIVPECHLFAVGSVRSYPRGICLHHRLAETSTCKRVTLFVSTVLTTERPTGTWTVRPMATSRAAKLPHIPVGRQFDLGLVATKVFPTETQTLLPQRCRNKAGQRASMPSDLRKLVAGALGFEPRLTAPKTVVLTLGRCPSAVAALDASHVLFVVYQNAARQRLASLAET